MSAPTTAPFLWDDISTLRDRRCACVEIFGPVDSGKSTLALSAPPPIAYIHTFEKLEFNERLEQLIAANLLRPCGVGGVLRGSTEKVKAAAEVQAARIEGAVADAYSWARSIVLDIHGAMWQIYQLAKLGSLTREGRDAADQKKGQLMYAELNARWLSLFKQFRVKARETNRTNLIMVGQVTEEYAGSERTGRWISHGMKQNAGEFDVRLRTKVTTKQVVTGPGQFRPETTYSATIEKPWANGDLRGAEIDGPMLELPFLLSMITKTELEEWQ